MTCVIGSQEICSNISFLQGLISYCEVCEVKKPRDNFYIWRRRRKGREKQSCLFYVHLKYKWGTLFKGTFVIPSFIARNSISYARTTFLFAHSAAIDTDCQQTYLTADKSRFCKIEIRNCAKMLDAIIHTW